MRFSAGLSRFGGARGRQRPRPLGHQREDQLNPLEPTMTDDTTRDPVRIALLLTIE